MTFSFLMRLRSKVIGSLFASLILLAAATPSAHAIALGTTDTSAFSDFSSPYYNMDLSGVVSWNGSSAVAIGARHLLTANHVGGSAGSTLTLNGLTYTAISAVTAPADPGSSKHVDLRIITLDRDLPTFYNIRSAPLSSGTSVVIAGFGSTGEDHGDYYSATNGRGTLRWGTNQISYPAVRLNVGSHSSTTFSMKFNSGLSPFEAGFAAGDSGGGAFVQAADGSWELAGINAYASNYNGISDQFNQSYAVSLADHMDWIAAVTAASAIAQVPEPTSLALLGLAALPLATRRRAGR